MLILGFARKRRKGRSLALELFLRFQDLAALIHAGLEVDMMRTAQFAGLLVLDPGHCLKLVSRAAHADAAAGHFLAWNGH